MNLKLPDHRLIIHAKHTGSWMTVRGTKVTDTVLVAKKISDFMCARYNVTPL